MLLMLSLSGILTAMGLSNSSFCTSVTLAYVPYSLKASELIRSSMNRRLNLSPAAFCVSRLKIHIKKRKKILKLSDQKVVTIRSDTWCSCFDMAFDFSSNSFDQIKQCQKFVISFPPRLNRHPVS